MKNPMNEYMANGSNIKFSEKIQPKAGNTHIGAIRCVAHSTISGMILEPDEFRTILRLLCKADKTSVVFSDCFFVGNETKQREVALGLRIFTKRRGMKITFRNCAFSWIRISGAAVEFDDCSFENCSMGRQILWHPRMRNCVIDSEIPGCHDLEIRGEATLERVKSDFMLTDMRYRLSSDVKADLWDPYSDVMASIVNHEDPIG